MRDNGVRVTAALLEALVSRLLYLPTAYPALPNMIQVVHDGDARDLGTLLARQFQVPETQNFATHAAVECRDRPNLREALPDAASMLDRTQLYGVCEGWSDLGPAPLLPSGTTVPTLIMAGQFDPVAPPSLSRRVADSIVSSVHWLEFPGTGHNVRQYRPCAAGTVPSFIDPPAPAPTTSCVRPNPSIPF